MFDCAMPVTQGDFSDDIGVDNLEFDSVFDDPMGVVVADAGGAGTQSGGRCVTEEPWPGGGVGEGEGFADSAGPARPPHSCGSTAALANFGG